MNAFARRDQLIETFRKESKGSFQIIYRALKEAANESTTGTLVEGDVTERIKRILSEKTSGKK